MRHAARDGGHAGRARAFSPTAKARCSRPAAAEALADAVRGLLADEGAARRLADGGLETYRAQASEDVLAPRWREVVERVVR